MFTKHFAVAAIATALLSTTALAQSPAPASKDTAPAAQSSSTPRAETPAKPEQSQSANEWRSSKVVGLYVYNDANERLGSINELLMDSSGKVAKAVIGVGGFLGIGESNIAVNFDQLKFVNEPMRTSSTATPSTGATGTSGTGATGTSGSGTVGTTSTTTTAPATTASKPSINPDHAKLSMTKEQLKDLPQFKFAN